MGETEACPLPQGPQPGVKYPIKEFDHSVLKMCLFPKNIQRLRYFSFLRKLLFIDLLQEKATYYLRFFNMKILSLYSHILV